MRVFYSVDDLPAIPNAVVTVGSYDGLHYGHRLLLEEVKRAAATLCGESVVVTFWPHPRKVLPTGGSVKMLNTLREKLLLLEEAGIDNVVVLPFTTELAGMTAHDFVRDILVGRIGMKHFVVGYNHRFGSDRKGDFEELQKMQPELGFTAQRVARHDIHEDKVSSTVVRDMISRGDMQGAGEFLTRGYIVIAAVRDGHKVIVEEGDKLLPPPGTYTVEIESNGDVVSDTLKINHQGEITLERGLSGDREGVYLNFIR